MRRARGQLAQQPVEADAGEHGERRHHEQEMAQAGEGGAAVDDLADHRENRDEDAAARFPCAARRRARGAAGQSTNRSAIAGAGQHQQRQLDQQIGRHVPARHVAHLVDMAVEQRVDLIVEFAEIDQPRTGLSGASADHGQAAIMIA